MSFFDNEPALAAGICSLAAAVVAVLIAFNVPVTTQQRDAILGLAAVVAPMLAAVLVRANVVPVKKVNEKVSAAVDAAVVSVAAAQIATPVAPPPVVPAIPPVP